MTLPALKETELHAMHLYVIECDRRQELMEYLRANQIGASLHYPLAVHQHAAYACRVDGYDDLQNTEAFYLKNLSLPLYPELEEWQLNKIIKSVNNFFNDDINN